MKGKSFKELIEVILTPFLAIFVPWFKHGIGIKVIETNRKQLGDVNNFDVEEWDIKDLTHFD